MTKTKKRLIKAHSRRGLRKKKFVRSHYRKVSSKKKPSRVIMNGIIMSFDHEKLPITPSEISKMWGLNILTVKKYLSLLAKKGRVKKKIIHGTTYWVKVKK
ncbi:hypothetical protein HQ533_03680 [Candidatus Woesearchaeota archaeon]|nr:hypothetical protein [Candidatus Woesearchaeota archaeon]